MRRKKVWRYYCEFCRKGGCSAGHMKKHETRCTMNPGRECGFCLLYEIEPAPMLELIGLLPNPDQYKKPGEHEPWDVYTKELDVAVKKGVVALRDRTEACPACVLAALRQSGIASLGYGTQYFDYKSEAASWFSSYNDGQVAM